MLQQVLSQSPADAFARYGLAMEYANLGKIQEALQEFETLLKGHPDYVAGYFMAAQTLSKANRNDEARKTLQNGISAARRTGNEHALGEMQGMLADLG